jgi:hypothetical protein
MGKPSVAQEIMNPHGRKSYQLIPLGARKYSWRPDALAQTEKDMESPWISVLTRRRYRWMCLNELSLKAFVRLSFATLTQSELAIAAR